MRWVKLDLGGLGGGNGDQQKGTDPDSPASWKATEGTAHDNTPKSQTGESRLHWLGSGQTRGGYNRSLRRFSRAGAALQQPVLIMKRRPARTQFLQAFD
jgi:hypothetical protein